MTSEEYEERISVLEQALGRVWNELTDPYGEQFGYDPRDRHIVAVCIEVIENALGMEESSGHEKA